MKATRHDVSTKSQDAFQRVALDAFRLPFLALLLAGLSSGCMPRLPNPVMLHQWGDEHKSCAALKREADSIDYQIRKLAARTSNPFNLQGATEPDRIEMAAFRKRYDYLLGLSKKKRCGARHANSGSRTSAPVQKKHLPSPTGSKKLNTQVGASSAEEATDASKPSRKRPIIPFLE